MKTFLFFLFIFAAPTAAFSYNCTSSTHQDTSSQNILKDFLAGDRVYVKISCKKLPPGEYSLIVNWTKSNHGTVRTDKNKFIIKRIDDREVFFWMKVGEMGLGNRMISMGGYNTDLIGRWTVNPYLNDDPINVSNFTVN